MRELLMIISIAVLLFIVVPRPDNANGDTYQELFDAYAKKQAYYDVEGLLSDEFIHEETDLAQRIWNGIDSLHDVESLKIDSLNKVLENGQ